MYAIYGNMDPINIPPMLAYIPYMDPMGINYTYLTCFGALMFAIAQKNLLKLTETEDKHLMGQIWVWVKTGWLTARAKLLMLIIP